MVRPIEAFRPHGGIIRVYRIEVSPFKSDLRQVGSG